MKILKMIKEDNNRYWEAFIESIYTPQQADIIIYHGLKGGKYTRRQKHVTEKNIGRSNYTDASTQAWKEILSLGRAKLDEGYIVENPEVINDSDNFISNKLIFPMLATSFDKVKDKILKHEKLYLQPKLDGARCLAYLDENKEVVLQTRNGKYFETLEHIKTFMKSVFNEYPDYIFDGEIYVHGWSFQRIISAIKKTSDDTETLQYHIYDIAYPATNFDDRYKTYSTIFNCEFNIQNNPVRTVESLLVSQNSTIYEYMEKKIAEGYEGIMIRTFDCPYRFDKRSNELVKYKEFQDKEYVITDGYTEQLQNGHNGIVYSVRDPDDMSKDAFGVRPKGTMEERMRMFDNLQQDIGKLITVRFQEFTDDGYPRFPVGIGVRDYE